MILLGIPGCQNSPDPRRGGYQTVHEIVTRLSEDGIPCEHLIVRDAARIAKEKAPQPELTPPGYAVLQNAPNPSIREAGECQFEGSPKVLGKELASAITIYENNDHQKSIREQGFPGIALIYGDNWAVSLTAVGLSGRVADSLGGRVVPPTKVSSQDIDLPATGPRCFTMAAIPSDSPFAAENPGITRDPARFARAFGEAAYYLPPEVRREMSNRCRRGLKMEAAVRTDARLMRGQSFEHFWISVCRNSSFELSLGLALPPGQTYSELGDALTESVLGETSLTKGNLTMLARGCGRAVEVGVIGAVRN